MAFKTVTTTAAGLSNTLEVYNNDVLLTTFAFNATSNNVTLSARGPVVTDFAGISPAVEAVQVFMRQTKATFDPPRSYEPFRMTLRRTGNKVDFSLGQGGTDWAAAEMDRDTRIITYAARAETVLSWSRFVRFAEIQAEFLALVKES